MYDKRKGHRNGMVIERFTTIGFERSFSFNNTYVNVVFSLWNIFYFYRGMLVLPERLRLALQVVQTNSLVVLSFVQKKGSFF